MKNICLLGASLDTANRGVSALATSFVEIITNIYPSVNVTLLVGGYSNRSKKVYTKKKEYVVDVSNYRLSLKAPFASQLGVIFIAAIVYRAVFFSKSLRMWIISRFPWLRSIEKADLLFDVRGGDSFSDIYGLRVFLIHSLARFVIIIMGKKIILLPQTVGPFKHPFAKIVGSWIIKSAPYIMTRDKESSDYVKRLLKKQKNCNLQFCPDMAFMLEAREPPDEKIKNRCLNKKKLLIGFNVSGLLYSGGYTGKNMFELACDYSQFAEDLLKRFIEHTTADILLIPHTFGKKGAVNSDPTAIEALIEKCGLTESKRVCIVEGEPDQYELKWIISNCDFFIGSRMHSCIAALSKKVPTAGVAYSKKFNGVFESVGMKDFVIDLRYETINSAIEKVFNILQKRKAIHGLLNESIPEVQKKIMNSFKKVLEIN